MTRDPEPQTRARHRILRLSALTLLGAALLAPSTAHAAGGGEPEPEDVIPPVLAVTPLPDAGWHDAPTTYHVVATDNQGPLETGVSFVHYKLSGATTATGNLDRSVGGDLTVSNEGVTRIEVEAVDGNGNSDYADFEVRVDRTAPTVAITSPQAGSGVVTIPIGGTTRLHYACSDPGAAVTSGVASCGGPVASGGVLPAGNTGQFVVDVTARDNAGNVTIQPFTYRVSSAITTITPPAVTGTPQVGAVLSGTPGTYSPTPATTSCRWQRDGLDIAGATSAVYTVLPHDLGHDVTYRCTLTSAGFPELSVPSAALHVPLEPMPQVVTNARVSGTGRVGETLTLDYDAQIPFASGSFSLTVRWTRDGTVIPGATARTYVVAPADHGHQVSASLHAEWEGHIPTDFPARNAVAITGLRGLEVTGTPAVTGTPTVGQTLRATLPEVRPSGPAPVTPYATTTTWLRDGQPIAGESGPSYILRTADAGHRISVRFEAAGAGYDTKTLISEATAVVQPGAGTPGVASAQLTAHAKALGHRAVRIKVKIAAGAVPVTGEVVVRRGEKVVGHGVVSNGRVVIKLRKQAPGIARYRVTYAGSPSVAPTQARLRVRVR